MASKSVVLYTYKGSPFGDKTCNMLLLKHIPYHRVDVPLTLPRPQISDLLGVAYRRIPVLAIGNDLYCDTSLIAPVLERRFPESQGYPTLFPRRKGGGSADTGLIKALASFYFDRAVFPLPASSMPYNKFPESFLKDRSEFFGTEINAKALEDKVPKVKGSLASHLALLEEQLSDGREWLFDTESPSLADVAAHIFYSWASYMRILKDLFDKTKFQKSVDWLSRMKNFMEANSKSNAAPVTALTPAAAAALITSGSFEDHAGFDSVEADRLGVKLGQTVSVAPNDTGKTHSTSGKLLGLNREELVIEVKGSSESPVHCHFPRLNFIVEVNKAKL